MKEKEKKNYEAPALTVVKFKTERGYALSGVGATRSKYVYNSGDDGDGIDGNNSNQSWF